VAPSKMQRWKTWEWKTRHQMTGVENAGVENVAPSKATSRAQIIIKNPTVIWEEPRRHPSRHRLTTPQSPQWLQWDAPNSPPKLPIPLGNLQPHLIHRSNTSISLPTPLTTRTAGFLNFLLVIESRDFKVCQKIDFVRS